MQIQPITNQPKFSGKLFLTGKFEQKPQECLNLVKNDIDEMVKSKNFNIYIFQNYLNKTICFFSRTNENKTQKFIQTTSEPSEYIRAVNEIIKENENINKQFTEQKQLQKSNNIECSVFSKILKGISILINKTVKP